MKIACVDALAGLARVPPPEAVAAAYGLDELRFGPDYLIPKPFDTRLIVDLPAGGGQGRHGHRRRLAPAAGPRRLPPAPRRSG